MNEDGTRFRDHSIGRCLPFLRTGLTEDGFYTECSYGFDFWAGRVMRHDNVSGDVAELRGPGDGGGVVFLRSVLQRPLCIGRRSVEGPRYRLREP